MEKPSVASGKAGYFSLTIFISSFFISLLNIYL